MQLYKIVIILFIGLCISTQTYCESGSAKEQSSNNIAPQEVTEISKKVEINPSAQDNEIKQRLTNILKSTNWFENTKVEVNDGVVILRGETSTPKQKQWAEDLANKTQDVVTVVNQIKISHSFSWYSHQFALNLNDQWQNILYYLPYIGVSILILFIAGFVTRIMANYSRKKLIRQNLHPLLSEVIAKAVAFLCFLVGLYIVLQILGLTTMALTILGGTGVIGIILGIAFRDITENLLASILLSIQNPFHNQDLVEIAGVTGYVQALNIRTTVLLTTTGHEVQIPNATVYKSNISNFTSNPSCRVDFVISIGYDDAISVAQEIALRVLQEHSAILQDPEPWVLVDGITLSTVNLRVFFWLNTKKYNSLKVRSSVIRLIKRSYQDANISVPGEVITVNIQDKKVAELINQTSKKTSAKKPKTINESSIIATDSEGGLSNNKADIQEQARHIKSADKDVNLLKK